MKLRPKNPAIQPADSPITDRHSFYISNEPCSRLLGMTAGNDSALFNCILSALGILFSRYSGGSRDIQVNTPLLNISPDEAEEQMVPLLFSVPCDCTLRGYLNNTQVSIGNCYLRANGSLAAGNPADPSNTNLFVQYAPLHQTISNLRQYDLCIAILRTEERIALDIVYNKHYFDASFISRMQPHIESVFCYFSDPDILLADIDILSQEEHRQLDILNATQVPYPSGTSVIRLFEAQAKKSGDLPAVAASGCIITYRELDQAANNLAHYLQQACNVQQGDIIGIMADRGPGYITAMVAALKTGAAYLPIDPQCPRQRQQHMLEEAGVKVLLVDSGYLFNLDFFSGELFALDMQLKELEAAAPLNGCVNGEDLAYVIYTSGSTGSPKGVMVSNASLINLCEWHRREFAVDVNSRATLYANIAFDAAVWEVWPYLLAGACLYPLTEALKLNLEGLVDFFAVNEITHCFLPSPICAELHNRHLPVNEKLYILTGGDELRISGPVSMNIINNYGPTESTVVATSARLRGNLSESQVPIGKPIDNIQVLLLDDELRRVPVGVEGELYISGDGLAKGYLNHKGLTEGKFIENPFNSQGNGKMYATGDIGCWREDGNLLFKGRKDDQVKIRGYRIEPGEIQACLLQHPLITDAIVLLKAEQPDHKYLCVYYTAAAALPDEDIRKFLQATLPEYMIPAHFFFLHRLPLTPNGKTDTRALLQLAPTQGSRHTEAPRDHFEARMVEVWREALNAKDLGLNDNFFSHGGDSIRAIRLAFDVNEAFGAAIKLMDVFKYDTPAKLVNRIKGMDGSESDAMLLQEATQQLEAFRSVYLAKRYAGEGAGREEIVDVYPVADIQLGMLYHGLYGEGGELYHDQILHQVRYTGFDPSRFKKALELMTARHEILRTAFDLSDMDAPVQLVYRTAATVYNHVDLSGESKAQQENNIREWLHSDRRHPFDIGRPGLWRVNTFGLGQDIVIVVLICHHAIIDGWSDATFSTELNNTYVKLKTEPHFIPEQLTSSYKDYVTNECMARNNEKVRAFWKAEFAGWQRTRFLFALNDELSITKVYNQELGLNLKEKLGEFSLRYNISSRVVCFCVFLEVLRSLSLGEELIVGLHTHNRPLGRDSGQVLGCFLNTLPVKYRFRENSTWIQHLEAVNAKVLQVTEYGNLSLFEIARLNPAAETEKSQNPFFDTLFGYLDFHVYNSLDADQHDFASTFGRRDLEVAGQGLNNTFFNFIVNSTLNEFNLLVFYKSTQIDQVLIKYIAELFRSGLQSIFSRPNDVVHIMQNLSDKESVAGSPSFIRFNL